SGRFQFFGWPPPRSPVTARVISAGIRTSFDMLRFSSVMVALLCVDVDEPLHSNTVQQSHNQTIIVIVCAEPSLTVGLPTDLLVVCVSSPTVREGSKSLPGGQEFSPLSSMAYPGLNQIII